MSRVDGMCCAVRSAMQYSAQQIPQAGLSRCAAIVVVLRITTTVRKS